MKLFILTDMEGKRNLLEEEASFEVGIDGFNLNNQYLLSHPGQSCHGPMMPAPRKASREISIVSPEIPRRTYSESDQTGRGSHGIHFTGSPR